MIALARHRAGSVLRAHVARDADQRERDARALREPLPWVVRLLALQVAIQALAWACWPDLRARTMEHALGDAGWLFGALLGAAIGVVPEAFVSVLLEFVVRFVPSWICDRVTKERVSVLWLVGIAIAIAEGTGYAWIARAATGATPAIALAVGAGAAANGVLLWWVVRCHGLFAAAWTRLCLTLGAKLIGIALVTIAYVAS